MAQQRYSDSTPVTQMGLNPSDVSKLSAAGKNLTKGDLVQLWAGKTSTNAASATLSDIDIIKAAFQPAMAATAPSAEGGDVSCCCTPCCCATAVMKPIASLL